MNQTRAGGLDCSAGGSHKGGGVIVNAEKMEPLAVSAAEAARLLGVSRPTIYQYIGREDFPSFKLGARTLISVEGLRAWVEKQSRGEASA